MRKERLTIVNKLGLHARAAARLVQAAARFDCEVRLARNGRTINGKSIMGVMMLAASKGSEIEIETDGPEEEQAMEELKQLVAERFGEAE